MTDYQLCEIAVPSADEIQPSWVAQQTDDIFRADALATLGNLDLFMPVSQRVPGLRRQGEDYWVAALVAVEGVETSALPRAERSGLPLLSWEARPGDVAGRVLATASVEASATDNLHLANIGVIVAEEARRRGVGRVLAAACERIAREDGRTTLHGWAEHARPRDDADALVPPTGVGAVSRTDEAAAFALALGYALEQCERHSVCPLPIDETACGPLWDEAVARSRGYSLRTITGRVPDELAEPYCDLLRHFTTEAPSAGLDVEEEQWDVARLRRSEERREARGMRNVLTLAVHDETGAVAAATELCQDQTQPEVGLQEITVVDAGHRGRRLGMLVKLANARAFHEAMPEVRRLHTWNAGENRWMLAINDAMGFEEGVVEGAWQKRLGDA